MCTTVGLPFESAFAPHDSFALSFLLGTQKKEEGESCEEDIVDGRTLRRRSDGVTVETEVQVLKERADSTELRDLECLINDMTCDDEVGYISGCFLNTFTFSTRPFSNRNDRTIIEETKTSSTSSLNETTL